MVAGAAAILYPDAEAHAAHLVALRRASNALPIAEAFDDLVETAPKIAVNAAVTRLKRLADGKQVPTAEIIGVDPEPPRNHVDLRFRRKAGLGPTKTAKRAGRHRVGAHRVSARRHCVPPIGAGNAVSGLDHRKRAGVRIGAAIELDLALASGKPAILSDPGFQYQHRGMIRERQEALVQAETEAHRPTRLHCQKHD